MSKIRLELDRLESYALLAAHEYLRQLFSEDGGIPFIRTISPVSSNIEYTEVRFSFEFKDDYDLAIKVDAGDVWPKKGVAHLIRVDTGAGEVHHDFELRGNPGEPQVVFTRMRGGG
ncbi:MAG: hypothetical protein BMS9Abin34_541 [Patescibacteria group bacterium]|nr:MAG: hypothetical protein BMS9Abin34_541 [Patescibacteria group bacterium]